MPDIVHIRHTVLLVVATIPIRVRVAIEVTVVIEVLAEDLIILIVQVPMEAAVVHLSILHLQKQRETILSAIAL